MPDDIEVSSDQYCIPGAVLSASRRISHQQFHMLLEEEIAYTGCILYLLTQTLTLFHNRFPYGRMLAVDIS